MNNNQDLNNLASQNNNYPQQMINLNQPMPPTAINQNLNQNIQIPIQNTTPQYQTNNQINNKIPNTQSNNIIINQPNTTNSFIPYQPVQETNINNFEQPIQPMQSINPFDNSNQDAKQSTYIDILKREDINIQEDKSKFLSDNAFNETSINDLNITDNYNNQNHVDYRNDPKVIANLNNAQKKTITITKELKLVIIIALVLFVFIFIMPYIFDFIQNIKY